MPHQVQIIRAEGKALEFTRRFDAPRELVWMAYSEAEHLKQWWGPKGWTTDPCTVDFRPGGVWHYCMKGDGMESWGKAVYQDIAAPERIVYLDAFSDEAANSFPPEMLITLDFVDEGGATLLRSTSTFPSEEDLQTVLGMGVVDGIGQTMDCLDEYLVDMMAVLR
ncbi:MAG: SRPBCC domain-containing protein [Dehalococcoidia bacterium]|nr:SRPBCC domain-containing protein [Dehalococcoidia bacterium]